MPRGVFMSPQCNDEWISIGQKNMTLSKNEIKFIKTTLMPILDSSPSGSYFALEVCDENPGVKGVIRVNSVAHNFIGEVRAKNIFRMSTELKKDLLKKIEIWKLSRFL